MSDVYVSPKNRVANIRERTVVAQTDDWQIQHDHLTKRSGTIFKVTDKRDEAVRIADGAPLRRVWSISFNVNVGYFGGDDDLLRDFYPEVERWARAQIIAYCATNNLALKKAPQRAAKKPVEAA